MRFALGLRRTQGILPASAVSAGSPRPSSASGRRLQVNEDGSRKPGAPEAPEAPGTPDEPALSGAPAVTEPAEP